MAKELLPLCSVPKISMRDGWTGATARILLPFYEFGYWFPSGQQYTFPNSTAAQDPSMTMIGTTKPNTFTKGPGICLQG